MYPLKKRHHRKDTERIDLDSLQRQFVPAPRRFVRFKQTERNVNILIGKILINASQTLYLCT